MINIYFIKRKEAIFMDSGGRQCGYLFIINKNNKNDGKILRLTQSYCVNVAVISARIKQFIL